MRRPTPTLAARLAVAAPVAAWAYLALGHGRFWSTAVGLPRAGRPEGDVGLPAARRAERDEARRWPPAGRDDGDDEGDVGLPPAGTAEGEDDEGDEGDEAGRWPPAAIVVPARNESELLPRTLPLLLAQDYPGPLHIVVVDDRSSDGTGELARSIAREHGWADVAGPSRRLSVLEGGALPGGWAGKPWAMAQGVQAALEGAEPPVWVLFTDADIAHPPGSLSALVRAAQDDHRQGLSLMARLSTEGGWEKLLMPAFVYFFAQIYPFSRVNDRRRRTAAAAGGCLLVEAEALRRAGGVAAIADRVIDDVALARALRRAGADLWLGLAGGGAPGVTSLRRYPRLADIWDMVARSAYTQLHNSPLLLVGSLAGLSAVYLAPPVMAVGGLVTRRPGVAASGLASWTAMTATYLPMARYYGAAAPTAAALPFTAALYMAMTVSSALRSRVGHVPWRANAEHGP